MNKKGFSAILVVLMVVVVILAVGGIWYYESTSNSATTNPSPIVTSTTSANNVPTITNIAPAKGPPETQVTITGTNFTPTGNTVLGTGNEIQNPNISSPDGTTLTFRLNALPLNCPAGVTNNCNPAGTYQLTVTNANGTSNGLPFTLTVSSAN